MCTRRFDAVRASLTNQVTAAYIRRTGVKSSLYITRAKSGHFVLLRTHFAIPSEQLRRCAHDVMVITKMRFLLIGRK